MIRAIALKELREVSVFAGLGALALLLVTTAYMDWNPLWPRFHNQYPFVSDGFHFHFGLLAIGLATALGLWQVLGDQWGQAQLFLLHRPVSRGQYFGTKLLVGLAVYLLVTAPFILLYGGWAKLPGSFPGPFVWSMTSDVWKTWLAGAAVYLGAVLAGLRPGVWLGTRLAPWAASFVVMFFAMFGWWVFVPSLVVACTLFISLIYFVANVREAA